MTEQHKNKEGLRVLIDVIRYVFLGSAILIIILQLYIYYKSGDASLYNQLYQMSGAIYPLAAFVVITLLKNSKKME
ncbi:hypothetical protein [Cyclobacterium lianum]|nr:hypothetical protein [Cyclobacterium lianum]